MSTPDESLTYEAARERLQQIVRTLESGGVGLAETMQLWEEGERMAKICQRWLDGATAKIDAARTQAQAGASRD